MKIHNSLKAMTVAGLAVAVTMFTVTDASAQKRVK